MSISQVDGLLAEMRAAIAAAQGEELQGAAASTAASATGGAAAGSASFSDALKTSLDSVARADSKAEDMQQAFVMGNKNVSLSDVMIQMQKAGIQFQATVQVRNKVVAAYNDIMNMQV